MPSDDVSLEMDFSKFVEAMKCIDLEIHQGEEILRVCQSSGDALDRCVRFYLYLLVIFRDLHLSMHAVMREEHAATQNIGARYLAVFLSEFFDDIHHAIGKYLGPELRTGDLPKDVPVLIKEFKKIAIRLEKPDREWLGTIRNVAAAHRDIDPIIQLETIAAVDVSRILHTASQVSDVIHSVILLVKMSGLHASRQDF